MGSKNNEDESAHQNPFLVVYDNETESIFTVAVASKATKPWIIEFVKTVLYELGYGQLKVAIKCDGAKELQEIRRAVANSRTSPTVPIDVPVRESKANGGGSKHGGRGPTSGTRDGPSGTESARRGEEPEGTSKGAGEGNASLSHISSADFVPQISPAALQTQLADEMLAKQDQVAQALRPGKLHMTNLERMFARLGSGVREVERQEASAAYKETKVWVPPLTEANLVPGLQPHYLNMLNESSSYNSYPKLATVGGYVKSSTAIQMAL